MGMTKFTVRMSRTLRKRLEEEAMLTGRTLSEIVRLKLNPYGA